MNHNLTLPFLIVTQSFILNISITADTNCGCETTEGDQSHVTIRRFSVSWSLHISLLSSATIASCPNLRGYQESSQATLPAFLYCQRLARSLPTLLKLRVAVMTRELWASERPLFVYLHVAYLIATSAARLRLDCSLTAWMRMSMSIPTPAPAPAPMLTPTIIASLARNTKKELRRDYAAVYIYVGMYTLCKGYIISKAYGR